MDVEECGEIKEMKGVGMVAAEGQFASAGQNGSKCDGPDVQHEHCVLSRSTWRWPQGPVYVLMAARASRCADGHKDQSMCRWPQGPVDVQMATRTSRCADGHKGQSMCRWPQGPVDEEVATRAGRCVAEQQWFIRRLDGLCTQVWYADDSAAIGKLAQLREWWDKLATDGPSFGYFANPSKTWLVTKDGHHEEASAIFADSGVNITADGRPYLGAAIGSQEFIEDYVRSKVKTWSSNIAQLSEIAMSQPHASFTALTHGLQSKWTYLCRVIPNIGHLLSPLDEKLRSDLLSALILWPNSCKIRPPSAGLTGRGVSGK